MEVRSLFDWNSASCDGRRSALGERTDKASYRVAGSRLKRAIRRGLVGHVKSLESDSDYTARVDRERQNLGWRRAPEKTNASETQTPKNWSVNCP